MYYYKDHSADWWKACGRNMLICLPFVCVAVVALLLMPLYIKDLGYNWIMILLVSVAAQGLQMYCQYFAMESLSNAKAATILAEESHSFKPRYKAAWLWMWFASMIVFMVAYGVGFAATKLYIMIGLPVAFVVAIVILVFAVKKTKEMKTINEVNNGKSK